MPKFYFNFASRTHRVEDPRGIILDGINAAHLHALRLIRRTVSSIVDEPWRDWTIEISDRTGKVLLTVLFLSPRQAAASFERDRTMARQVSAMGARGAERAVLEGEQ